MAWTKEDIEKAKAKATNDGKEIWITDTAMVRGEGQLRMRVSPTGREKFYFRYTNGDGKQKQIALDVENNTYPEARDEALRLSKIYKDGHTDLHAYLEEERAKKAAHVIAAKREREEAQRLAASGSLEALCLGYVAHLERLAKPSAKEARNLFKKHVSVAFPAFAAIRAKDITHRDINTILAKLIGDTDEKHPKGKGRTAGKLRAYLHAAYAAALQSEYDPTIHPSLHGFALALNPVAAVPAKTLAKYNVPGERVLTESELRGLMAALKKQETLAADGVLLCLYMGGQRIAQTLRLRLKNVNMEESTVTLYDPKGARQIARKHVLPLNDPAKAIIERRLAARAMDALDNPEANSERFLFAHRETPLRPEKLSAVVTAISEDMGLAAKAKGETVQPFQLKDVRRTVETMLAKMGISSDVCAQLLSHGLGGVQVRHYNRHSYMDEKKAALEAWAAKLEEIETGEVHSNVTQLRAKG